MTSQSEKLWPVGSRK